MDKKIQEDFLWGTLIGTVIGAATALLLTPTSGIKLRQKMVDQLQALNGKFLKEQTRSRPTKSTSHAKTSSRARATAIHHHKTATAKKSHKRTRAR